MKTEELFYKKVYIKSEADLPLISERHFICKRNGVMDCWTRQPHDDDEDWVKRVDWYLRPVSYGREAIIEVDKKSLLHEASYLLYKKLPENCPDWIQGIGDCNKPECEFCRIQKCIDKLDMFATELSEVRELSQSRQDNVEIANTVTDEEIEKRFVFEAKKILNTYFIYDNALDIASINFAKWLHSRMSINVREELIKYDKWLSNHYWGKTELPTTEKAVNKYLKNRLQPAQSLTDEQIEKWADNQFPEKLLFIEGSVTGAKAMRDGKIAEWVKNQK
jgi:hypothetical protein